MLYGETIAVCTEIHTKQINTLCGRNVEFLNVKLAYIYWPLYCKRDSSYVLWLPSTNVRYLTLRPHHQFILALPIPSHYSPINLKMQFKHKAVT